MHSSAILLLAERCFTGRTYVHRRSTDVNVVEIHEDRRELLNIQVYAQIKYLSQGSHKPTKAPKKCVMKIRRRRRRRRRKRRRRRSRRRRRRRRRKQQDA